MVAIPKNVAEAIETVWETKTDEQTVKYLWLTNWNLLQETHPDQFNILVAYAKENPVNYMQALTNGYEIEFDKNMVYNVEELKLCFCDFITVDEDYYCNTPIALCVGENTQLLSIEDANNLSDNLLALIQELNKVRSEI
jgi:hypothetical protein